MTDEEYVRARWKWVQVRLAEPYEGVKEGKWVARLPLLPFYQTGFDTEAEAWSAARAFTEQRALEIVDVEEEIAWLSDGMDCSDPDDEVGKRILAVEQARLAELRRGMKEGSE